MDREEQKKGGRKKKPKPAFFSFENLKSLAILILIIFAVRWSVASPYHVPTPSMEPTIKVGDRLLAFKLSYNLKIPFTDIIITEWGRPQRGDIIVFRYPGDPDIDYVKRVVAIAGDKVALRDGYLFINGKKQQRVDHNFDRSILADIYDDREEKLLYREEGENGAYWVLHNRFARFVNDNWPLTGSYYVVPEDAVFVMGDNRHNSTDSREWKDVPLPYVKGKALIVLWSIYTPRDRPWYDIHLRLRRSGMILE